MFANIVRRAGVVYGLQSITVIGISIEYAGVVVRLRRMSTLTVIIPPGYSLGLPNTELPNMRTFSVILASNV